MIERLSALTPRAKVLVLAGLIVMVPLGGWVGYNLGYWMGTH